MHPPIIYTVHIKLPNITDLADDFVEKLYAPAFAYYRKQLSIYEESDPAFANQQEATLVNIEDLKRRSKLTKMEDSSLQLSMEIEHFSDTFDEQDAHGQRPWLRNYVDDFFFFSVVNHLLHVQMKVKQYSSLELQCWDRMFEAFQAALHDPSGQSFWIENECTPPTSTKDHHDLPPSL